MCFFKFMFDFFPPETLWAHTENTAKWKKPDIPVFWNSALNIRGGVSGANCIK